MPIYEIEISLRTHLTVLIETENADEAWVAGETMANANAFSLDSRLCSARRTYLDEVHQVRLHPGIPDPSEK